jgi:hypothetical protein
MKKHNVTGRRKNYNFRLILLAALILLFSASSCLAYRGNGLKEKLTTLRNWQLMEEFDLSPERAQKVFSILDRFDDMRADLLLRRRKIIKDIMAGVETKGSKPGRLDRLMKSLAETNVQLARLPEKERNALSGIFSMEEQARYILFAERFAKNLRRILMNERMNGNRRGPVRRF